MANSPRILLLVGDEGVLCVPCDVPGITGPFFAANGDMHSVSAILTAVKRFPAVPITLLADTLAQDIKPELIPRLNPLDRSKLLRRRLQQVLPQARLAGTLPMKAPNVVLMAGLQENSIVFGWLKQIEVIRPKNPPDIALLPVESAGMAEKLLPEATKGWALFISRQRTGGFRQIVTHAGEVVFSRLTPAPPLQANAQDIATSLVRDITATRSYLARLGLDERAALQGAILVPESYHDALRDAGLPLQPLRLMTPREAATHLGLRYAPPADDPYGDLLFALWVLRGKKLRLPLISAAIRRTRQNAVIRRWGMRAATVALLTSLGSAAWNAGDLFSDLMANERESASLSEIQNNLAHERAEADPITEPAGRLRQALERRRLFTEPAATPWPVITNLQNALGEESRVEKFVWQDASGKTTDETLTISARLTTPPKDREETLARFQQLAAQVESGMQGYRVTVAHYPFPALPQEPLSNTQPDKTLAQQEPATEFTIARVQQ